MKKVKLDGGIYLAEILDDDILVTGEKRAKEFATEKDALEALAEARKYGDFPYAEICEDFI